MKRIAAIVINSVSHDARVLKQADSLAAAGYEVAVFGIQDNRAPDRLTQRESGAVIHRVDWKRAGYALVARAALQGGIVLFACALLLFLLLLDSIHEYVRSEAFVLHAGLALIALATVPFVQAWLRYRRMARQAAVASGAIPPSRARLHTSVIQKIKGALTRLAMKRAILAELARFEPDVVHCHDLNAVPIGYAYTKRAGVPLVFDSHELYEEQSMASPMQKRIYQWRQRRYSGKVDAFITINDSIANYLIKKYPRLPRAVIVKNATLPEIRTVRYDGRLHRAAGLEESGKILLYQGGFAKFRGLGALVKAGGLLPEPWRLVMMGWGKFEPELKAIANTVDPQGKKIRFIPAAPQRELAEWTSGGALGVIPYENVCLNHWFCTPNKLWEYPVAGVPILCSPFPEMEKTVGDNGIGRLLSDPVTPENIAAVVASISEAELEQMRRKCREYIARDNWSVYEKKLVGVYDGLFGVKAREAERSADSLSEIKTLASEPSLSRA